MTRWVLIIRTAVLSLLQHRLRSALSALGVFCGVTAVTAMLSVGEGARLETERQLAQLGARNIYIQSVPLTEAQREQALAQRSHGLGPGDMIRISDACPAVVRAAAVREIRASVAVLPGKTPAQVLACSADWAEIQGVHIIGGRFISDRDTAAEQLVCVVGRGLAERMGSGPRTGHYLRIGGQPFRVVGVQGRPGADVVDAGPVATRDVDEMIVIPLGIEKWLVQERRPLPERGAEGLTEIVVEVDRTENVDRTAALIRRVLAVSHHGVLDYRVVVPRELLRQSRRTQRIFNIVLATIAGISLMVGGIGIMNIMLATVSERTAEIGLRRALGACRGHIVAQFLAEAVVLTFCGGAAGLFVGLAAVGWVAGLAGWPTAVTAFAVTAPLAMSITVGVFFGLYPACRASRMDPIAALRR